MDTSEIGVDFIDILFGLVVTEIFTAFTNVRLHELATWANLVLALVVVVFSWIGYHKAKSKYSRSLSFTGASIIQFFVDIGIVAIYLALVKEMEHTRDLARGTHPVLSIRPEAVTMSVIFALYLIWDLLQVRLSASDATLRSAASDHSRLSFRFLLLIGTNSAVIVALWKPNTNVQILIADVIFLVLCYLYRICASL
jgi:hypothetical protein